MASTGYNIAATKMGTALFNPVSQTVKAMALNGITTTPDNPDHVFVADISADECTDGTYARVTLTTKTGNQNDTTNAWEFDHADIDFGNVNNETITGIALYVEVTNDADSWLISYHDVADTVTNGTGYTAVVGSNGSVNIAT